MSQAPHDHPAAENIPTGRVLPHAPREITPEVRRHAWREPKIRATWLGGLVILLACVYLGANAVVDWRRDNQLFSHGVMVQAVAFRSGEAKLANRPIRSDYVLNISYTHEGKPYNVVGSLPDADSVKYYTGQPFDVRIDPSSPGKWTTSKEGMPLYTRLVGVYILSACAIALFAAASFWHWAKLRLWKTGEVAEAIVDSHGQSALAPRSTVVRCHLASDRRSSTIFQVFIPPSVSVPPVGGRLRLICNPANPAHCLVADAYAV